MAAHDSQHGGETQAAAGELGGKERIKDAGDRSLVHALTGVLGLLAAVRRKTRM